MAQSSQQYYRNGFNTLSESRIKAFAQSFWDQQNIHPTVPTHVGQQQYIERTEWLIVNELSRATQDFQRCIGDIWNSFQDHQKRQNVFDLTLKSVGGNDCESPQFLVDSKANIKRKSGDRIICVCKCIFEHWDRCDIRDIIDTNRFKIEAECLNCDQSKQYAIISVKNAFDVFASENTQEIKHYCDHIRHCRWTITDSYALNLFKIQIENVPIFIGSLNVTATNHDHQEKEELEMKTIVESETNTKRNKKRKWSDLNTDCDMPQIIDCEPIHKKRKIVTGNCIIDENEYHMMKPTPQIEGQTNETKGMKTQQTDKEGEQSDDSLDEDLLQHLMTSFNANNTENQPQIIAITPVDTTDPNIPPAIDLEDEIKRDCVSQSETISNESQLTAIQSIILHKSAKHCGDRLMNINDEQHKEHMIELYEEYNRDLFEFKSPNEAQYTAICRSILSPICIIQGPPGTGKTSTCGHLVNTILMLQGSDRKMVTSSGKIFVTAFTHNAINELLNKLTTVVSHGCILRIGDKNKCPKQLHQFCLEQKLSEMKTRNQTERDAAIESIFNKAMVIIGNIYSLRNKQLMWYMEKNKNVFDWLLIDEATQITDPVLTIAINALQDTTDSHVILVGDQKQLPPVIKSKAIAYSGYKTLFETLVDEMDEEECGYYSLLDTQYRMPRVLMDFCNAEFYGQQIKSQQKDVDWNDNELQDILQMICIKRKWPQMVSAHYAKDIPIFVIKIPNVGALNRVGTSWSNTSEAKFICHHVLEQLPPSVSTGIISFYKSQSYLINGFIYKTDLHNRMDDVSSSTVDAFQGKEKDLVILSLVTDVLGKSTSHNADHKRINVALSRCKKALIIVTSYDWKFITQFNSASYFNGDKMIWRRWFRYFESNFNGDMDPDKERVRAFLQGIKMSEYYALFIANGFDHIDTVCDMNMNDLQMIGILKLGHRKKIHKEAKKLIGVHI
eukprot:438742_1